MTPHPVSALPPLKSALHGGIFAGLITLPDGTHHAVVLLPDSPAMTPHPNAQALHALIDGEEVQWRNKMARENWHADTWQSLPPISWLPEVYEWRLKPAKLRYRVALMNDQTAGGAFTCTADGEDCAANYEDDPAFIRWLTDWQEVEA